MTDIPQESPVITLRSGLSHRALVVYLAECAIALAEWHKNEENRYKSPELARATVEAYKVAVVTELIFKGSVVTHRFSEALADSNNHYLNAQNFNRACEEVVTQIDRWERI